MTRPANLARFGLCRPRWGGVLRLILFWFLWNAVGVLCVGNTVDADDYVKASSFQAGVSSGLSSLLTVSY